MPRTAKPEHVVARQQVDDDFSWLDDIGVDDAPKKNGPAPDLNSGRQKMLRRKEAVALQKKRKGISSRTAKHRIPMTESKWKKFLQLLANGMTRQNILKVIGVSKETFDAYLITSIAASKQLREADAVWLRRDFSWDDIEAMLTKLTLGRTLKTAGDELGWDELRQGRFYRLVRCDTRIQGMYDMARELQSEAWMDENIDIADGEGTFVDAKGIERVDTGAVQRDRMRIETRQWTMGAMNRKRFGDHKFVDHSGEIQVNHAVQLSNARKRLEKAHKQPPAVIDNESQQVVNE
jgi:hypothetical protein